jgi:hypothetical protein
MENVLMVGNFMSELITVPRSLKKCEVSDRSMVGLNPACGTVNFCVVLLTCADLLILHLKSPHKKTSVVSVRKRTIPTERPQPVGEVLIEYLKIWNLYRLSHFVM